MTSCISCFRRRRRRQRRPLLPRSSPDLTLGPPAKDWCSSLLSGPYLSRPGFGNRSVFFGILACERKQGAYTYFKDNLGFRRGRDARAAPTSRCRGFSLSISFRCLNAEGILCCATKKMKCAATIPAILNISTRGTHWQFIFYFFLRSLRSGVTRRSTIS